MFDPEVSARVRAQLPDEPAGPREWQRPLKETFLTTSQRSLALQFTDHVKQAATLADLEPSLRVYSWDPPVGFHLVIVDPFSRAAIEVWEEVTDPTPFHRVHHVPSALWSQLCLCVGLDRTPEGYINEVPLTTISQLATDEPERL
jgi:hypothetical protein